MLFHMQIDMSRARARILNRHVHLLTALDAKPRAGLLQFKSLCRLLSSHRPFLRFSLTPGPILYAVHRTPTLPCIPQTLAVLIRLVIAGMRHCVGVAPYVRMLGSARGGFAVDMGRGGEGRRAE